MSFEEGAIKTLDCHFEIITSIYEYDPDEYND